MLTTLSAAAPAPAAAATANAEGVDFFESKIRPILIERCYSCHSVEAKKAKAGLLLDTREGIMRGGETGPAVVPGDPEASLLMKAIRYLTEELTMPPEASDQLTPNQVADFAAWITMGAPDPRTGAVVEIEEKPTIDWEKARKHWSWKPMEAPSVPNTRGNTHGSNSEPSWARTPIDNFVLAKLQENNLQPAPDADRETLLRRVTFDLTGLPPTARDVKAFLADKSPRAFARVVDRLLASRHYGERWGRHWLDVVHYSDTAGDSSDFPILDAWRYRNWVIEAFNADKPYDVFLQEQVAGDLLPSRTEKQRQDQIIATGFIALARRFQDNPSDYEYLTIEDTLDTMGRSVLGLALSCARCHDHKFDPIPTRDYYGLYGILDSTQFPYSGGENGNIRGRNPRRPWDLVLLLPRAKQTKAMAAFQAHLDDVNAMEKQMDQLKETNPPETAITAFRQKIIEHEGATRPDLPWAFALSEKPADKVGNVRVQHGGDPNRPGSEAPRGFLTILGGQRLSADARGSGRLELARWLTDPKNPLTARVMANRIWQYHFGEGIVRTPNDFGTRGAAPTHPGLLDYLANRFIEKGWSMKAMHREILLSRVYQMATVENEDAAVKDPANQFLWTWNRQRLDAESVRDALLAVSGDLDGAVGREHPFPGVHTWRFNSAAPFLGIYEHNKRSIYLMSQRLRKAPFFEVFDGADPNMSTPQRSATVTPLQALFFMNAEFTTNRAAHFAERIVESAPNDTGRIQAAYLMAFARTPTREELLEAQDYLGKFDDPKTGWKSYAKALLSCNEFTYLD